MELGKQIKKYRSEKALSQDALAEKIYVSRQTISNWENDKSYPDVNSLVLLSKVFKLGKHHRKQNKFIMERRRPWLFIYVFGTIKAVGLCRKR